LGKIFDAINALSPTLSKLCNLASQCDTYALRKDMLNTVYQAFHVYMPLSNSQYRIASTSRKEIYLGKWIRVRYEWNKRGSYIKSSAELYSIIKEYGEVMIHHVRSSIRDEFKYLVYLTKQLKEYKNFQYSLKINKTIYIVDSADVTKAMQYSINRIVLETDRPFIITVRDDDNGSYWSVMSICNLDSLTSLEDILEELIPLYEQVLKDITAIKEHNDQILEEMRKVTLPAYISMQFDKNSRQS